MLRRIAAGSLWKREMEIAKRQREKNDKPLSLIAKAGEPANDYLDPMDPHTKKLVRWINKNSMAAPQASSPFASTTTFGASSSSARFGASSRFGSCGLGQKKPLGFSTNPFGITSAPFSTGGDGDGVSSCADKAKRQREMNDIFDKLWALKSETLDFIMREQNKKGVSVSKADLLSWAKLLDEGGKPKYALEIFEWMDKEKMKFTPSQLALFVDLLGKMKGFESARDYFKKVDPDFNENNHDSKNWHAFMNLMYWLDKRKKQSRPPPRPPRTDIPLPPLRNLRANHSTVPRKPVNPIGIITKPTVDSSWKTIYQ